MISNRFLAAAYTRPKYGAPASIAASSSEKVGRKAKLRAGASLMPLSRELVPTSEVRQSACIRLHATTDPRESVGGRGYEESARYVFPVEGCRIKHSRAKYRVPLDNDHRAYWENGA